MEREILNEPRSPVHHRKKSEYLQNYIMDEVNGMFQIANTQIDHGVFTYFAE